MRLALVCTLVRAQPVLASWINHHRALGIEQFYLFVDDPSELAAYQALGLQGVQFFARDAVLMAQWQTTALWSYFKDYLDEVYARQCLNVDLALALAKAEGVDWLAHLDIDELLVIAGRWPTLAAFFEAHASSDMVQFTNHEAVPEAWHIGDYFAEVTLFKRNPALLSDAQRHTARQHFGDHYFLAYSNGKSAARIGGSCTRAYGAHEFTPCRQRVRTSEVCVLHYPQCGFNWYFSKFQTLGNFKDRLLDLIDITAEHRFLTDSRRATLEGSIHDQTALYAQQVMAQGGLPRTLAPLLAQNILFRLPAPAALRPTA